MAKGPFVSPGEDKRCHSDISATQMVSVTGGGITCSTELPCEAAKKLTHFSVENAKSDRYFHQHPSHMQCMQR